MVAETPYNGTKSFNIMHHISLRLIRLLSRSALRALAILLTLLPQLTIAISLEEVNRFPVELNSEAFLGTPLTITVDFLVYFPIDEVRYKPVTQELARLLCLHLDVDSPPGLDVRILHTSCEPKELSLRDRLPSGQTYSFSVTGAEVSANLEITASPELEQGDYRVTVHFPVVDSAYRILNSIPPAAPAMARLELQVWASKEAKEESMRQIRIAWMKRIGLILGIFTLTTLLLLWLWRWFNRWFKPWFNPSFQFTVPAGGHSQKNVDMPPYSAEPGSIVTFRWARSFLGRRQRIKVETLWTGAQTDLLVSVGASVRPGWYVAGNVRVKVPRSC